MLGVSKQGQLHNFIVNNYSSKWMWIAVDIYWALKQQGKYPPLLPTLRWIIVLVYTTQITKDEFISFSVPKNGWKSNSWCTILPHWLLAGEYYLLFTFQPANQHAIKALFTWGGIHQYIFFHGQKKMMFLEKTSSITKKFPISFLLHLITSKLDFQLNSSGWKLAIEWPNKNIGRPPWFTSFSSMCFNTSAA